MKRYSTIQILFSTLASVLQVGWVSGEFIPIENASFEQPVIPPNSFNTSSAPPGWTPFGNLNFGGRTIGVLNPNTTTLYTHGIPEGQNVGVTFLAPENTGDPAGMFQTLSTGLQARTHYRLTMGIGNINNDTNPPNASFNFTGFPGYIVELLAGTNVVGIDNNSLLPDEGRFLTTTVDVFTTSSPIGLNEALAIRLTNLDGPGLEVNFDDLQLESTSIPLPTIDIALQTNGQVQINFSDLLEEATSITNWIAVSPQPPSPHVFSPTNDRIFFRSVAE